MNASNQSLLKRAQWRLTTATSPKAFPGTAAALLTSACLFTLIFDYHSGFDQLNAVANQLVPAEVWGAITLFGDALLYIALAAAISMRHPEYIWLFFLGGLPQAIIVNGIKHATEIDRPLAVLTSGDFYHYGPPHDWGSFPSGHTATAALGCGLIMAMSKNSALKLTAIVAIILVALSRIALGVHWPVDVMVGAAIGLLNVAFAIWLARHWTGGLKQYVYPVFIALMALGCWQLIGHDGGYPWAVYISVIISALGLVGLALLLKRLVADRSPQTQ